MKIATSNKIKDIDAMTVTEQGITSFELMKRAADALTKEIMPMDRGGSFIVFAGAGNNGGDALLTAINLHRAGKHVKVFHFNTSGKLSADCGEAKAQALATVGLDYTEITKSFTKPRIGSNDIIIDGLFGTGLNKPLRGAYEAVIAVINDSDALKVSIDMPSGLMCEDNSFNNMQGIVKADITLALHVPKLALLFQEYGLFSGEMRAIDIGLSNKALEECGSPFSTIEFGMAASMVKRRKRHTHKGNYGKALIVAGSYGMSGAATLAAKGCLRSGIGLLKVQVPSACTTAVQSTVPEAIVCPDFHEHIITSLNCDLDGINTTAIGPGLGQAPLTEEALKEIIEANHSPMVIDADAINIISENRLLMKKVPAGSILTPHIKEFDRLAGNSKDPYERLNKARAMADEYNICILLKSSYTAAVMPGGKVYFNTAGNPGMATGGSGDVLTGVATALLAQGYGSFESAILSTFAHSLAGDIAARAKGEIGMTASDIADCLPQAWQMLSASSQGSNTSN